MSAKSSPSPEPSNNPAAGDAPRVRRISNPRPKKTAKPASVPDAGAEAGFVVKAPEFPKFPEFPDSAPSAPPRGDWAEPDAASEGTAGPPEHAKRKRRRKKGKGHNPQLPTPATDEEVFPLGSGEPAEPAAAPLAPAGPPPPPSHAPRVKIDPEVLATRAWKIYLSEVSEEGVALIGDTDAKELARRCFKLAEIFIEEQARRR